MITTKFNMGAISRCLPILIILLLGSSLSQAQVNAPLGATPSSTSNYIQTFTPRTAMTDASQVASKNPADMMQTIQYFDGLGRPIQVVQVKGNNDATKDVIQPISYDEYGRESTKYLPYADGSSVGTYRSTALDGGSGYSSGSQYHYYNTSSAPVSGLAPGTTASPYAVTSFEPSPLNRVVERGAPGDSWQLSNTHTVKLTYKVNDPNTVRYYYAEPVTTTGNEYKRNLREDGYYAAGELYLTITKNENWKSTDGLVGTSEEYKDKRGHVVLKRYYTTGSVAYSTYYVYDDLGNLSFVLTPGASPDDGGITQAKLDNFCYQYRYDGLNRVIQKRVPGRDWDYIVYHPNGKVAMTQDGAQRNAGKWFFTKYDDNARPIITGICISTNDWASQQQAVATNSDSAEWMDYSTATGYSDYRTYPYSPGKYLAVTYYDSYLFPNVSAVAPTNNDYASATMLPTGTLISDVDGTASYLTALYYDAEGQVTENIKQNHLGGLDHTTSTYSFTGELLTSTLSHSASGKPSITVLNSYTYDHMGRKVQNSNQINSGAAIVVSKMDYNDLGQPVTKHLHSDDNGSSYLQNLTYTYNERGWLRTANTSSNLLNIELRYDNPGTGITPNYNGNISQLLYNTTSVPSAGSRQFSYTYDPLNRLTIASSNTGDMDETVSYNSMGDIVSLNRTGPQAATLSYSYTDANGNETNQLQNVNNGSFRIYTYDINGNATSNGKIDNAPNNVYNKHIEYNLLNLPKTITQTNNASILATYTYDATGNKLRNAGNDGTWDYDGLIVYQNGSLAFVQTEEGKAVPNGTSFNYIYNLKDHLGNVRVSFDKFNNAPRVKQENEYYSFGLIKSEYDASNHNRYLYNGKEKQVDLEDQYDYGARFYDPVIARWSTIDPLAETSRRWSPYNYVSDNPMNKVDPDGMADRFTNDNPWTYSTSDPGEIAGALGGAANGEYLIFGGDGDEKTPKNSKNASQSQQSRELSHDQELNKYGRIVYGYAVTSSLAFVVGATVEMGWVVTDKRYIQYYFSTYYTGGLASPSLAGNFFSISPSTLGNQPTFSDWKGVSSSIGGGVGFVGFGGFVSDSYKGGFVGFSIAPEFKALSKVNNFFQTFRGVNASGSIGNTTLIGNPRQLEAMPHQILDYILQKSINYMTRPYSVPYQPGATNWFWKSLGLHTPIF